MLLFDGHLDLSMNALQWNRDITLPLMEMRRREEWMKDKPDRGRAVCTLPEMQRGGIGLCVATQICRYSPPGHPFPGAASPEIAWATTQGQLAYYRVMEEQGRMRPITTASQLTEHADLWRKHLAGGSNGPAPPIGYVLSLEGADSIVDLSYLEKAHAQGLRALGPAHYGPGRYAPGTSCVGPLEKNGPALLREMRRLGIILDVTHFTDEGFWQALEIFDGPTWASHSNCRALVPDQRQLNDDQIRALIARGAVIGVAFDAWMMHPHWVRGATTPGEAELRVERAVLHIDHVCQLAGNARHSAIGSDLDGGFGREQTPLDLHTIADLRKLATLLAGRGYNSEDIAGIMHGNWIRFLCEAWR